MTWIFDKTGDKRDAKIRPDMFKNRYEVSCIVHDLTAVMAAPRRDF